MTRPLEFAADTVIALLSHAASEELLPRFKALAEHQIFSKATDEDPTDVVTEADLAMESRLTAELEALLPGSVVMGEEAVAKDPSRLALLSGDRPVWVLDPLDGTRNFAKGSEDFGVLLALVERGCTRWGFLHQPLQSRTFAAEEGAGAFLEGRRLGVRRAPPGEVPSGMAGTRYMSPEMRGDVDARAAAGTRRLPSRLCAATEYAKVALGEMDFVLYWRLLPWDHLAGGLIASEAGGAARHVDGSACAVGDGLPGSLVTHDAARWDDIRRVVVG